MGYDRLPVDTLAHRADGGTQKRNPIRKEYDEHQKDDGRDQYRKPRLCARIRRGCKPTDDRVGERRRSIRRGRFKHRAIRLVFDYPRRLAVSSGGKPQGIRGADFTGERGAL